MKTLPEVDIRNIWEHYFKYRDIDSRNTLWKHYLPLVKYTAERLLHRFPKNIELDDLQSSGIMGLMDAINKFDPARQVRFETYCVTRIQGTIIDDLRKKDWVPRLVRARAQALSVVYQRLESLFGRIPTDQELADELDMNLDDFYDFQRDANAACLISLDGKPSDPEGEGQCTGAEIIADSKSQNPFHEVHKRDFIDFVKKGFSRQEQLVILLYYFEEMTMNEIGLTLGISESRVCQLHSSIMVRLRERNKLKSLCAE